MNDRSYKKSISGLSSDNKIKLLALAQSAEITSAPVTDLTNAREILSSSKSIAASIEYNSQLTSMIADQSSPIANKKDEQVIMMNRAALDSPADNNQRFTRRMQYSNWFKAFYFAHKAKLWTLLLSVLVTTAVLTCSIILPPIPVLMSAVAVAGLTTATAQIIAATMLSVVYSITSVLLGTILDKRRLANLDDIVFPVEELDVAMPIAAPVYSAKRVMTTRAARINVEEQKQGPVSLSATSQTLFGTPTSSAPEDINLKNGTPITIGRSKAI